MAIWRPGPGPRRRALERPRSLGEGPPAATFLPREEWPRSVQGKKVAGKVAARTGSGRIQPGEVRGWRRPMQGPPETPWPPSARSSRDGPVELGLFKALDRDAQRPPVERHPGDTPAMGLLRPTAPGLCGLDDGLCTPPDNPSLGRASAFQRAAAPTPGAKVTATARSGPADETPTVFHAPPAAGGPPGLQTESGRSPKDRPRPHHRRPLWRAGRPVAAPP
jgi:hypothetical protein